MALPFTKMQGCGNDYIYVEAAQLPPGSDLSALSVRISDRHFGVGADGLVVILRSGEAHRAAMRIFNADGSEAEMCGNASRCVGRYAIEHGWWPDAREPFYLDTKAGLRTLWRDENDELSVNIGRATYCPVDVDGQSAHFVTVGNPHCIFFVDDISQVNLTEDGQRVENNTVLFPHRTNVEFAEVLDSHTLRLIVWERGSGITLACGTGAAAAAFASHQAGFCDYPITLRMPGGHLTVTQNADGELLLSGAATTVYKGEYPL